MSLVTPKLYPIVDLDGIDLAEVDGHQVQGIYNKIRDNLNEDKIEIFYHWYFADIMLTPYRVVIDDSVTNQYIVNNAILIKSDDTVSIIGHVYIPVIESLSVNENGTYDVPSGVDGYAPVVVDVPTISPVLVQLNVTENGTYTPATGVDGFSQVEVNVPTPAPVIIPLSVTENGIYMPSQDVDGFSQVSVNVPGLTIDPIHSNINNGYVYQGWFIKQDDSAARSNVYQLESGKSYIVSLGSVVGNRFRVAFFNSDPINYTADTQGTAVGTDVNNPSAAASKPAFTPSSNGYLMVMTSSESQEDIHVGVIELNKI